LSNFEQLAAIDVSAHTQKKGQFTYLAWTFAHAELAKRDPEYTYWSHDFPADSEGVIKYPYLPTPAGCFVRVTVKFEGKEWAETLPVLDFKNKTVSATDVTAMDINTATKRCFVKAAAHFGIGLHIYQGLDAPPEPDITNMPAHQVIMKGGKFDGFTLGELATKAGRAGLGHVRWLTTQQGDLAEKAKEVWESHRPELSDDEVTDELADIESLDELTGLWRCLTKEQEPNFQLAFAAVKDDLKAALPKRDGENNRG